MRFEESGHDVEECVGIEGLEEEVLRGIEEAAYQCARALARHEEDGNIGMQWAYLRTPVPPGAQSDRYLLPGP